MGKRYFLSDAQQTARNAIAHAAREAVAAKGWTSMSEPVAVTLSFFLERPTRTRHKDFPMGKPDADNLGKQVLDACNGVIWDDDARVVNLSIDKRWARGDPYTLVIVSVVR